jgi:hypothetical protein
MVKQLKHFETANFRASVSDLETFPGLGLKMQYGFYFVTGQGLKT